MQFWGGGYESWCLERVNVPGCVFAQLLSCHVKKIHKEFCAWAVVTERIDLQIISSLFKLSYVTIKAISEPAMDCLDALVQGDAE